MEALKAFLILHQENRVFKFIAYLGLKLIKEGTTTEEMRSEIDKTIEIYQRLTFCQPVWREINFLKDMRKQLE